MYETLERRATTLVLVTGLVVPLTALSAGGFFEGSDLSAALTFAALGLLTAGLALGVAALFPAERTDRLSMKAQLVFWAHAAFAAGVVLVAANTAYLTYRLLRADPDFFGLG